MPPGAIGSLKKMCIYAPSLYSDVLSAKLSSVLLKRQAMAFGRTSKQRPFFNLLRFVACTVTCLSDSCVSSCSTSSLLVIFSQLKLLLRE